MVFARRPASRSVSRGSWHVQPQRCRSKRRSVVSAFRSSTATDRTSTNNKEQTMAEPFVLPPLPFAPDALAPVISANTIGFHYGKHHKTYLDNLNKLVPGTEFEGMALEQIVNATAGKADKSGVFNNAAQVWNHTFYWNCLKPSGGGMPRGDVAAKLDSAFSGFDN